MDNPILALRKNLGYNQQEFCSFFDLSRTSLYYLENGIYSTHPPDFITPLRHASVAIEPFHSYADFRDRYQQWVIHERQSRKLPEPINRTSPSTGGYLDSSSTRLRLRLPVGFDAYARRNIHSCRVSHFRISVTPNLNAFCKLIVYPVIYLHNFEKYHDPIRPKPIPADLALALLQCGMPANEVKLLSPPKQ